MRTPQEVLCCANSIQDISDAQYYSFRKNVPYLAILLACHPVLRKVYNAVRPLPVRQGSPRPNGASYMSVADGEARKEQRASFDFGFAIIFLAAIHGFSGLKVMAILYANYSLATGLPRQYVPAATWIFNIGILFANELSDGYKFVGLAAYLSPLDVTGQGNSLNSWGVWLDKHSGIIPRWEILFNLTVLRLISFNLDYYWSLDRRGGSPIEVCGPNFQLREHS